MEMQRRDMTRRGQNPYSANSSSGFANSNSPASSVPAYDQRSTANFSQLESDRAATTTRSGAAGFKTKGMQLGSKSNKESSVLAQALGGLNIDEPLAERPRAVEREEQVQTPTSAPTPTAGGVGRSVNPFGEVEEFEYVPSLFLLSYRALTFRDDSVFISSCEKLSRYPSLETEDCNHFPSKEISISELPTPTSPISSSLSLPPHRTPKTAVRTIYNSRLILMSIRNLGAIKVRLG